MKLSRPRVRFALLLIADEFVHCGPPGFGLDEPICRRFLGSRHRMARRRSVCACETRKRKQEAGSSERGHVCQGGAASLAKRNGDGQFFV